MSHYPYGYPLTTTGVPNTHTFTHTQPQQFGYVIDPNLTQALHRLAAALEKYNELRTPKAEE